MIRGHTVVIAAAAERRVRCHPGPHPDLDGRQVRDRAPNATAVVDRDGEEIDDASGERHDADPGCGDGRAVCRCDVDTPMARPSADGRKATHDPIWWRHGETGARRGCPRNGDRRCQYDQTGEDGEHDAAAARTANVSGVADRNQGWVRPSRSPGRRARR